MPATITAIESSLSFVRACARRYTQSLIDHRWGEFGSVHRGLVFAPSAYAKLGAIFGWIDALAMIGRLEEAAILADKIVSQLDYLASYGQTIPDEAGHVPGYLVTLYDDGTFAGFSFCAYVAIDWRETPEAERTKLIAAGGSRQGILCDDSRGSRRPILREDFKNSRAYAYRFSFNGGLLYHGPGASETFAVTLNSCLWSIHT